MKNIEEEIKQLQNKTKKLLSKQKLQERKKRDISTFRAYAAKFAVGSSSIFCSINARSASVTGTRRVIVLFLFAMFTAPFRVEGLGYLPTSILRSKIWKCGYTSYACYSCYSCYSCFHSLPR